MFSAGADLGDLSAIGDVDLSGLVVEQTGRIANAFAMSPVPTVAAVNGAVAGAACGLVLMADIAIATHDARFVFPFTRLGLVPDTGLTCLLAQQIGAGRGRRILFDGGRIDAAQALEWGIVGSLHSPEALDSEALKCAAVLAAMPFGVHAATRALMSVSNVLQSTVREEAAAQAKRLREPETRAAIATAAQALSERRN